MRDCGFSRLQAIKLRKFYLVLLLTPLLVLAEPAAVVPGPFLDESAVGWKINEHEVARWKTLVGGIEGAQIEQKDIQFGLWELAPRSIYHRHTHAVPEIYYITEGLAEWTVGGESREVSAGMTIYTAPNAEHKMVNLTDKPVKAIWVWWAPGGDATIFAGEYTFTEASPEQPAGAGFKGEAGTRLYAD
jgi:quercetin dioxygenase-like cupin family protein